jgi:hypothetical protein
MKPETRELHPTKKAILDVAISELNGQGQGGFRIAHVLEESNASFSSLYHHFGSREGLIREANAERFIWSTKIDLTALTQASLQTTTTEEFFDIAARQIVRVGTDPLLRLGRQQRVEVLGFALTDPELLEQIIQLQRTQITDLANIIEGVQHRGLIRQDLDVENYVAWHLGIQFGHILTEIDPTLGPVSPTWNKCAILSSLQPLTLDREPIEWLSTWDEGVTLEQKNPLFSEKISPQPISDHPTAKVLLANTIAILETGGEEAVRLPLVLEGTGTSVTSIYHFFGNREGLIAAANAERFINRSVGTIEDFTQAAQDAVTVDDFFDFLKENLTTNALDETFIRYRWTRAEVLGSALRRPHLLAAISLTQRFITNQFATITAGAQERAFIRSDLDPAGAVLWFMGMQAGRILTEIQPGLNKNEEWLDFAVEGVQGALR